MKSWLFWGSREYSTAAPLQHRRSGLHTDGIKMPGSSVVTVIALLASIKKELE